MDVYPLYSPILNAFRIYLSPIIFNIVHNVRLLAFCICDSFFFFVDAEVEYTILRDNIEREVENYYYRNRVTFEYTSFRDKWTSYRFKYHE